MTHAAKNLLKQVTLEHTSTLFIKALKSYYLIAQDVIFFTNIEQEFKDHMLTGHPFKSDLFKKFMK